MGHLDETNPTTDIEFCTIRASVGTRTLLKRIAENDDRTMASCLRLLIQDHFRRIFLIEDVEKDTTNVGESTYKSKANVVHENTQKPPKVHPDVQAILDWDDDDLPEPPEDPMAGMPVKKQKEQMTWAEANEEPE